MPFKNFHEEWTQDPSLNLNDECKLQNLKTLDDYRTKLIKLFNLNYPNGPDSDQICTEDWGYICYFLGFHQCLRSQCGHDLNGVLPPELTPTLAWIRHILFPDKYPKPTDDLMPSYD